MAICVLPAAPRASGAVNDRYVYRQVHMGMQVRVVMYAPAEPLARRAAARAFDEIARLDGVFSNYRRDSELSTLVAAAGTPRAVGAELLEVLVRARQLGQLTAGAFDVTAAPLTKLWREAIARQVLPAPRAIAAARQRVGFERVVIDADRATVTAAAGTMLDLGGIAKGFVLDRALATLRRHGVDRALVEAGGDIVAGAAPPNRDGWRVEVPRLGCVVHVQEKAVATSGDEFQFVEIDGQRYSHVVDPRTGVGLSSAPAVTVVAPEGLTADGLATALSVVAAEHVERLMAAFPGARRLNETTGCAH